MKSRLESKRKESEHARLTARDLAMRRAALQPLNPNLTYTVTETAVHMGCSDDQVRRLIDAGEIPAFPISARLNPPPKRLHLRIAGSAILALIERRKAFVS